MLWHNPAHPGDHRLVTPASAWQASAGNTTPVAVRTLDGFLEAEGQGSTPIAFVKVDVQGAELAVFRGMERSLTRWPRAVVAFEYGFDPALAVVFFASRGYQLHVLRKDGALEPIAEPRLALAVGTQGYLDLVASARELVS